VIAGPGWGTDPGRERILDMLLQAHIPLVLDADGARLFARMARANQDSSFFGGPIILTPHPGEFSEFIPMLGSDFSGKTSETVASVSALAKKI